MVIGQHAVRLELMLGLGADAIGINDAEPADFRMRPAASYVVGAALDLGRPKALYRGRLEYTYRKRGGHTIDSEVRLEASAHLFGALVVGLATNYYEIGGGALATGTVLLAGWAR
jgi:hypothetical protein